MSTVLENDESSTSESHTSSFRPTETTESTLTATITSEPEPSTPKKSKYKAPPNPSACNLKAKGEFEGGTADLVVDVKSQFDCNRTQNIILEQVGRKYKYVRTEISQPKKEE